MEKHFDEALETLRDNVKELKEKMGLMAEDRVVRQWTKELVENKNFDVMEFARQNFDALEAKIDRKHEEVGKYVKMKFEKLQEKQFTVQGLVGENTNYPYNYLGEFL